VSNELKDAFRDFDALARSKLEQLEKASIEGEIAKFAIESTLPLLVGEIEQEQQFHNLVFETQKAFIGDYHKSKSEKNWRDAIHNYFCQSGYYLDLMDGKDLSIDKTFAGYCNAFKMCEAQIMYLAPLEFVTFAQDYMDFGAFKIRRFRFQELETKLRNRVSKLFYPYAALDKEQLGLIAQYWFVEAEALWNVCGIGSLMIPVSNTSRVVFTKYAERICTDHPQQIESALKELCLFDWAISDSKYRRGQHIGKRVMSDKEDEYEPWLKFRVPFVLEIKGDLLSSPGRVPNTFELSTLSETDSTGEEYVVPEVFIRLDKSETDFFVQFIKDIGNVLHSIKFSTSEWSFFEIAFDYFTKAFFTYPGLEQLLWNIATIEALLLLDEEQEGLTGRLAKRIGSILGKDDIEIRAIAKRFRELYDVRSSLVHGKTKVKAHVTELVDAYRFGRLALLWFLHYLGDIEVRVTKGETVEGIPTHKEILTLLDIDKIGRHRVEWLMKGLSSEFPYMNDWIK